MEGSSYEKSYNFLVNTKNRLIFHTNPLKRRFIRLIALPYCFKKVNWEECSRPKFIVLLDFLYIFFKLKQYPENYSSCRLWEINRSEWKFFYGSNYDPYQRKRLRVEVQPEQYEIVFRDKKICYDLCSSKNIPIPTELAVVKPGLKLSDEAEKIYKEYPSVNNLILKPLDGKGGSGVIFLERDKGTHKALIGKTQVNLDKIRSSENLIAQEFISQHEKLNIISPSVNTVRVVTILRKSNEVSILGTYMRFGTGLSRIDNLSQGGVCVNVSTESGTLGRRGYDRNANIYLEHPTSRIEFNGYKIPCWDQVLELAELVQRSFPFYKLLGMDIAISESGPVIVEINSNYDNVDLEQACGPLLKNKIALECFGEYNLFFNKYQTRIFKEHMNGIE